MRKIMGKTKKVIALFTIVAMLMSVILPISAFAIGGGAGVSLSLSMDKAKVAEIVKISITDEDVFVEDGVTVQVTGADITVLNKTVSINGSVDLNYTVPNNLVEGETVIFTYTDSFLVPHTKTLTIIEYAPTITKVTAYNTGNDIGFKVGDSIEIDFSKAINTAIFNKNELVLANSDFGANPSFSWKNGDKTLAVVFAGDAAMTLETHIVFPDSAVIKIASGNSDAISYTYTMKFDGSFGTSILPATMNAFAINSDGLSGASATDKIAFVFDVPVKPTNIADKFNLLFTNGVWSADDTIFTIEIGTNTDITTGDTLSLSANSGIKDFSGELDVGLLSTSLQGSFDNVIKPSSFQAIAINSTGDPTKPGDSIALIFDTKTSGADIMASLGDVYGATATGAWSADDTIYTISLKTGATISIGDTINLASGSGLKDQNDNLSVGSLSATLQGSFGVAVAPKAVRAFAVDVDGTAKVISDKVNVVFDLPVKNKVITSADLKIVSAKLGDSSTALFKDSQTLEITIGAGATIKNGDTIDIASLGLTDEFGIENIYNTSLTLKGSFGTATTPVVMSATAISTTGKGIASQGDIIEIAFNTKVVNKTAITATATSGILGSAYSVILSERDNVSILTITLGVNPTITASGTISISGTILDAVSETANYISMPLSLIGSFGTAIKPEVVSVTAISTTGRGVPSKGDFIKVVFNTEVDYTDFTSATIVNGNLGSGRTSADTVWTVEKNVSVLTLILGNNPAINVGVDRLSINGIIKDALTKTKIYENGTYDISGTFGIVIAPQVVKVLALSTNGTVKPAKGDEIKVIFNMLVDSSSANVSLENGSLGTGPATPIWSEENGISVLNITLGDNPTIKLGNALDSTKISLSGIVKDRSTKTQICTNSTGMYIEGSFGVPIIPVLLNGLIVKKTTTPLAQTGDEMVFMFSAPTNGANIINGLGNKFGIGATGVWSNGDTTYTVALGTGLTIKDGDSITLAASSGLKDINAVADVATKTVTLVGSFGTTVTQTIIVPTTISGYIIKKTTTPLVQSGDQIVLVFDAITNRADISSKLNFNAGSGATFVWTNDNTYTITLGTAANIKDGDKIKLNANSGLKDKDGLKEAFTIDKEITLVGTFGVAIVPELLNATILKATTTPLAQTGDKIVFMFSAPTNGANIISGLGNKFGIGATGVWSNSSTTYTVTLGTGLTIKDGDSITLAASSGLKDINAVADVATKTVTLVGSFGTTVTQTVILPTTISGYIIKKAITPLAQSGDQIVLVFDVATNKANISSKLIVSAGSAFNAGIGATFVWTNDNTYTITLGTGANIKNGDSLKLNANSGLKDKDGLQEAFTSDKEIILTGTFGAPIVPELLDATILKATTTPLAQAGDKILFMFSAPTNFANIIVGLGNKFGMGATGVWGNSDTTYTVTLGTGSTIKDGDSITLATNSGLKDKDSIAEVLTKTVTLVGSFGSITKAEVISATAYSDLGKDYIKVAFNTSTNKPMTKTPNDIKVNSFTSKFGTNSNFVWNTYGNELTIELGEGYSIRKNDVLDFSGIDIKNLSDKTAEFSVNLIGELRKPVVLNVKANDIAKTSGATRGDTITITFSSRVDISNINLASISGLIGQNAVPELDVTKTILTITLGSGTCGIYDGSYIAINGLNIKNPFTSDIILGQYQIEGSFGTPTGDAIIISAIANSKNTLVTQANEGDTITLTFNTYIDQTGTANLGNLLLDATKLGTGATGVWVDSIKLVITLGAGATVKAEDTITFKIGTVGYAGNIKNANLIEQKITGSFDGRDYFIKTTTFEKMTDSIVVKAKIDKSNVTPKLSEVDGTIIPDVKPYYTFVLYSGDKVIALNSVTFDIASSSDIESRFYNVTGDKVKVFVTDKTTDDITITNIAILANTVESILTVAQ